jgi:hypothetical protein
MVFGGYLVRLVGIERSRYDASYDGVAGLMKCIG